MTALMQRIVREVASIPVLRHWVRFMCDRHCAECAAKTVEAYLAVVRN